MQNPRRVFVAKERLNDVVRRLSQEHPPGSGRLWGVNHYKDMGVVIAEEGIDIEGLVAEVLAAGEGA